MTTLPERFRKAIDKLGVDIPWTVEFLGASEAEINCILTYDPREHDGHSTFYTLKRWVKVLEAACEKIPPESERSGAGQT